MLVNPDFLAWIHSQTRTTKKDEKGRPLVKRGEKIDKGGADKANKANAYEGDEKEAAGDVDYLNERKTNLSFYA
ncbi:hypothetical protein C4J81_07290 [Deltaproteobacteria bacterium Smac51]|nr:hypothetical protein C4J81_07290 [Deltaproteobacteria bacterium Smac51]